MRTGRCLLPLAVVACAGQHSASSPTPSGLTGTWRTDGYGLVLEARGNDLQAYEVTQTTCVVSFKAARTAVPGADAAYVADGQVFVVTSGEESSVKHVLAEGAASHMVIRRIAARPTMCDHPTPDTPEGNFEVFARTWSEHYILFHQKHADWPATVSAGRAKITPNTTPEQLFDLLQGMIAPFRDAHTEIRAPAIKREYQGFRPETDRFVRDGIQDFMNKKIPAMLAVTDRHLAGPLRTWCNGQVQYGHVDDSTGYLRLLSESGYAKDGSFASGLAALEAALDTIFGDAKLKALVIDARINLGGADPYGLAIASRLATSEYVAYSKEARSDPDDDTRWTPGQPSVIRPSTRPGFKGPVVELTGPLTISAGETTTQALMSRTPRVIRIGEPTQGVFSDVLTRKLPNGWSFGLPNEVFRTADGKTFDGVGIPPDIEVPVLTDRDLAAGNDPGLDRAVSELRSSR